MYEKIHLSIKRTNIHNYIFVGPPPPAAFSGIGPRLAEDGFAGLPAHVSGQAERTMTHGRTHRTSAPTDKRI